MAALSAIHTAIVSQVNAVTGLTPAPVPFSAESIPDQLTNGGFIVRWETIDYDAHDGAQTPSATATIEIELLWRLTQVPNTGLGGALDKAEAVIGKLADDGITSVDARFVGAGLELEYPSDGAHVIVRVRALVYFTRAL